jgi:peptidyl-prolyl cis-trans isomerase D
MLQNIRKNITGTTAKVIVAIIVVPFALFGIESLIGGGGVQTVAEVNGEAITPMELQQQINQQKRRLLMSMGDNIDPALLDDQMLAGPTLEFLIQKKLYLQAAGDHGLTVASERLEDIIRGIAAFQIDGRYSPDRYRQVLSEQGYSPGSFQETLREDIVTTQLRAGISGSEFVTPQELNQVAVRNDEQRDLRYMVLPLEQFRKETSLEESEIALWYEENKESFKTAESVVLNYVELSVDNFSREVPEEEILELFELEREQMALPEERAVSHILFEQGEDESEDELQARIAIVVNELNNAEKSFAELAGEYSQDLGSANFGGDLGITSGESFPPEIEAVVATLELDQVSAPVQSDAGWHLLKVTEIRAGKAMEYEQVRADLESRLQLEGAERQLVTTVEKLRDMVFNAENLEEPAASLELEVQTSADISRDQQEGLFANPRLISAAFSKAVLEDRYNSEVIEVDSGRYVVLRVKEHKPASIKPLAMVREQIIAAITEEQARERIIEQADSILAQLHSGASVEALALEGNFQWQVELGARRDNRNVPPTMLARAFALAAPAAGDSTFDYVRSGDGDVEVFELVRVMPVDPNTLDAERKRRLSARMLQENSSAVDNQYQRALVASAEVVRS